MFGPRITTVFASRWKALWWCAGVLLTAYCTVPAADPSASGARPGSHRQVAHPHHFASERDLLRLQRLERHRR